MMETKTLTSINVPEEYARLMGDGERVVEEQIPASNPAMSGSWPWIEPFSIYDKTIVCVSHI